MNDPILASLVSTFFGMGVGVVLGYVLGTVRTGVRIRKVITEGVRERGPLQQGPHGEPVYGMTEPERAAIAATL